jgi:hypothetical protein
MSTLETSVSGHAVPTFNIFKPCSQEKVETLKHCFMDRMHITRDKLPSQICARDGLVYLAVYDCRFPETDKPVEIIISFQQHTYGRFAVVRVAKGKRRGN